MSRQLFSLNDDLKRLRSEGYSVHRYGGYLVMADVPYVNAEGQICRGAFASALRLSDDRTLKPDDHTILFVGEPPYASEGQPIPIHSVVNERITEGMVASIKFSRKPPDGYRDYHHQLTAYAAIFSGPAEAIDPEVNPRVFRSPEAEEDTIFNYVDTATSRAGIGELVDRLLDERIAIIGLGGTGSYVLDLVSKTPVEQIRLFDPDLMETHNAFRSPGAISIESLRELPSKVEYHRSVYANMHRAILAHHVALDESNIQLLDGVTFAFICIDNGSAKRAIIAKLEQIGASFIDCGMGINLVDGALTGIIRTTSSSPGRREHVHKGRISLAGGGTGDLYSSNIQIAELNAINAAMAVLKWKKIRGLYHDAINEMHSLFTIEVNEVANSEWV
jgi:hypothetical protein